MSNLIFEKIEKNQKRLDSKQKYNELVFKNKLIDDMNFTELEMLLDALLTMENLPDEITHRSNTIYYKRQSNILLIFKTIYRLLRTECIYQKYFRKKIRQLKENKEIYTALKRTGCIKAIHMYLYLAKIGLNDLLKCIGGHFNNTLFMNFTIATQLYDASFDTPECRKYLKEFETFIMNGELIESNDVILRIFNECVYTLKQALPPKHFDVFRKLVQIEHISQLMSIYQLTDKNLSQEKLRKITFSKGGIALLAIMYLFAPHMKEKEKKAIYELGAVMQIIDDIRDIKEDIKNKIQTLPNQRMLDSTELKNMFAGTVNNLIKQCAIDPHEPNGTLNMLSWFSFFVLEGRYRKFLQVLKVINKIPLDM